MSIHPTTELSLARKRELLRGLLLRRGQPTDGLVPLAHGQRSLWFVHQLAPDSSAYTFVYAARIQGDVDLEALRRACRDLARRHPLLRATFENLDGRLVHRIHDESELDFELHDAADRSWDDLIERLREDADRPFDLHDAPPIRMTLFRRGPRDHVLSLVVHHIVADLWSMVVLQKELRAFYLAEREGRAPDLPPVRAQYADYVRWQALSVAGKECKSAAEFWERKLAGDLPVLNLPTDHPRPAVQTYRGKAHNWTPDPAVVERVRALAAQQSATLFSVFLAAFQVLLRRYTGQEDIIIGTATADRGRSEWERVVGYFVNQVALRARITSDASFNDLITQARLTVLQALENQAFPFGLLVERLNPSRTSGRTPIFQVMFIWDKLTDLTAAGVSGSPDDSANRFELETVLMEQRGAPFDLSLVVFEDGPTLNASIRYNTDLFDTATIERMSSHFDTLLQGMAAFPDRAIGELPLLTPAEIREALPTETEAAPPRPTRTLHQLFQDQAARTPEAVALRFEDQTHTYRALDEYANRLARYLVDRGVRAGDLVGLHLHRGPDAIAAVLAIWKAGAAYVPIDPAFPNGRIADILSDAAPSAILTEQELAGRLESAGVPLIRLDADRAEIALQPAEDLHAPVHPDDLAYVIFTSGSTGRPKGVLIRHGGVANLCEAERIVFDLKPADRVLQFAPLTFDASVYEIIMALTSGASLVLGTQASIMPGPGLMALLRDQGVTVATMPPSILALLPVEPLPALRILVTAGEACPAELVSVWGTGRRFLNAYGPTEITVCSSIGECRPDGSAPTIGRPLHNFRYYVLDARLQIVPRNVPGELFIAGPGVALGYLNQPEPTLESFLPNPFDDLDGGVMYRTGDRVRRLPNGEIAFLGRMDHQVKIHGYRIELEEIQAVVRHQPHVRDAVVVTRPLDTDTANAIVAYVVPANNDAFNTANLRSGLREHLPHYMLPAAIVVLPELPLLSSGKVNRHALPLPDAAPDETQRPYTAPRDAVEKDLATIWSAVLGAAAPVGVHDNFFDLGGASLQTLEVVNQAETAGYRITPEMLFQYQTIADLAPHCRPTAKPEPPASAPIRVEAEPAPKCACAANTATNTTPRTRKVHTLIESLGVYLPKKTVTTAEVLAGCARRVDFPLERMTGIHERRMVGENEFAIDLAARALRACLDRATCAPSEIDLLICCNISRCDGPDLAFSFEPSTAAALQARFGLESALAFDISNACAGTFTAISIADAFLASGRARRALVVSGEYITHLTRTAQREIESFVDPRMACLTLGDSGIALLLAPTENPAIGFHDLDLFTLGHYHDLCVAKATDQPHGGAIMVTDAVRASAVTINQAVGHALRTLEHRKWAPESVDRLIMHQTSETTIQGAVHEINSAFGRPVCGPANVVCNLAERGNTATTTHFVALMDQIRNGAIHDGSRVLFGISGSGQTVGTALYTFDDLPERLLATTTPTPATSRQPAAAAPSHPLPFADAPRIRISAIGALPDDSDQPTTGDSVAMLKSAAEACLQAADRDRNDIGLVIHSGIYRTDFLSEPALAAIAAGELRINHDGESPADRRTLAFDLMDGATGTLTACRAAAELIQAGRTGHALVLASEVENNARFGADALIGIKETASALLLERSSSNEGFDRFHFRAFAADADFLRSHTVLRDGASALRLIRAEDHDARLIDGIAVTVRELLEADGSRLDDFARILPPHRSRAFVRELAAKLGVPLDRFVGLPDPERDYFTSSLACTLAAARQDAALNSGDRILIIAAGSGIHVGAAIYHC